MKRGLLMALGLLAATQSFAEPPKGFYSGAAISRWTYSQLAPQATVTLEALEANAGFWFNPLLSAEVRVGTSLGDRATDAGSTTWEMGIDYFGSIYWRPEVGNDVAKLYGLIGYSQVELSATEPAPGLGGGSAQAVDLSESGPSFGVGIGFYYTPKVTLNLEWKQLIDADGFEIKGYTAGFDYRF